MEFNKKEIINLKKREMIFEVRYLKSTTPLDPIRKEIHRASKRK
jgi:hypothetical protein